MDITISQFVFFALSFLTPLVLEWYRLRQLGPVDYREVFASSIEIIFASTGFIYTLVEKNSTNQILYGVTLVYILLALGFEKDDPGVRWKKNIALMIFIVGIPFYLLFFNTKVNSEPVQEMAVTPEIEKELRPETTNTHKIREICGSYLSGTNSIDEQELSTEIRKLTKAETDEMNLALCCLKLQRKDTSAAENYLLKVNAQHLLTDKNFILFHLHSSEINKYGNLNLDTPSWLSINNQKIQEIREIIQNSYKLNVQILILDASNGRNSKTTSVAISLKNKIPEFKSVIVQRFDYSRTAAKNLANSGFVVN